RKLTPTAAMNTSRPAVPTRVRPRAPPASASSPRHHSNSEKLSNAVEPSSVAATATDPGPTGVPARFASGQRTTKAPPEPRASGLNRPSRLLYTSSGSADSAHSVPKTHKPTTVTIRYPATHTGTVVTEPGAGDASSSQTKVNCPNAAGHRPHARGYRSHPDSGDRPVSAHSMRCTARAGDSSFHTGPATSEATITPTQTST